MSGGVGPTYNDITLPKEQEQERQQHELVKQSKTDPTSSKFKRSGVLPFWQINALAIIIVLSASRMVSPGDMVFVLFSFLYIFFLSKFVFPVPSSSQEPQFFNPHNKLLRLHIVLGVLIGLALPIAYIFEGVLENDQLGIKAATPPVFLFACQLFMDGVVFDDRFSTPIRIFVPVLYNSKRVFTIVDWLRSEFSKQDEVYGGYARRLYVGRVLAVVNLAFWSFNLFGCLLPVYLPKAFKKYYSAYSEVKE
ncbi:uncharacterized protein LOC125468986 [Pyrus x bretschneideri]|uniref:uncharacterized protein LOC125468986 n=1 Tax=Pyrus x bretschneideri TaxID=225117 RepID=UPI00202FD6A3|nr:uncharacterized protein LOC125468986 [Pyrus x bretschneideri]